MGGYTKKCKGRTMKPLPIVLNGEYLSYNLSVYKIIFLSTCNKTNMLLVTYQNVRTNEMWTVAADKFRSCTSSLRQNKKRFIGFRRTCKNCEISILTNIQGVFCPCYNFNSWEIKKSYKHPFRQLFKVVESEKETC